MIVQYFKLGVRSLTQNKVYTAFNIIGFAIGFTVCVTIALYVYNEATVNNFIPNVENTYRLVDEENETHYFDHTIASTLKDRFSEIEEVTTMFYLADPSVSMPITIGARQSKIAQLISVNNSFFDFMGIDVLVTKQKNPLPTGKSVVISKSTALKLFGHIDVIDEPVSFFDYKLTISAVVDDIPGNATFGAELYLSDELEDLGTVCGDNGCYFSREIYIKTRAKSDIKQLAEKLSANFPTNKANAKTVSLQHAKSIYYATPLKNDIYKAGNKKMLWLFISIAAITLFMSIFNYVNYTISKQFKTIKETGIRITAGAQKKHIIGYYVTEAALSIAIAFALSLFFTALILPIASTLLNASLHLTWIFKPAVITILLLLLVVVILFSVLFSIDIILKSDVNTLLGKKSKQFRAGTMSRIMTILQLFIAMVLLSGLLVINKQLHYVKTANYGFETNQLLRVFIPYYLENIETEEYSYEVVKKEFAQLPFIKNLSLTSNSPGAGWSRNGIRKDNGDLVYVNMVSIDDNFVSTFGMKLLSGREPISSDLNNALLITETTMKLLEWDSYEGKQIMGLNVIGLINDMNYNSMHSEIIPVVFHYTDSYYDALNIQLTPGNFDEQLKQMQAAWQRAGFKETMQFEFYNDYYQSLYQKEERESKALTIFSIVAFVITCIGMLGQVMQVSERRTKEIAIRKINGATVSQVVFMLIQNFAGWVAVAFIIATPTAYYGMTRWLEHFAYKTPLSWWVFALAGLVSLLITLFTVTWQSYRAATANPVDSLKSE